MLKNKLFFLILFYFFSQNSFAESFSNSQAQINKISILRENKIEILLDKKYPFKVFSLTNPNRLVVDIKNGVIAADAKKIKDDLGILKNARFGKYQAKTTEHLRIVFDLKNEISVENFRFEQISGEESGKIIININGNFSATKPTKEAKKSESAKKELENLIVRNVINSTIATPLKAAPLKADAKTNTKTPAKKNLEKLISKPVIVIDAGHGGKDPGAIGRFARTKEKDITLSYSKELANALSKSGKYKVYLTRKDDYFITLKNRVEKARKVNADLFISLHANSAENTKASGFSIYTLSENSSDKQAELLAAKENRSDIIAGIDFAGASPDIMKILIYLSQRSSMNSSSSYANLVIKMMKKQQVEVLQESHRFAGFMVLTAPDVTSVLIEIGYLSNKAEEKKMNSYSYRKKITKVLADSVEAYFNAR